MEFVEESMSAYEKWSLVLQSLFLLAGVLTVIVYYRQLRAMQGQLQALLQTSTRASHVEFLKLTISDNDIADVWRADMAMLDFKTFKQHSRVLEDGKRTQIGYAYRRHRQSPLVSCSL
jgi:hypothetical protein